jgi:hypothetical protein
MWKLIILLSATLPLLAQKAPERVHWDQTTRAFAGKVVAVRLTGGTRIEGSWAGVTASTFTIKVDKSSNRKDIPTGVRTLQRSSIASLESGTRRVRGRVIGAFAGFYTIGMIGAAIVHQPDALQGGWGLAASAGAVGGYFLGRGFDQARREVIVLPDN